MEKETDYKPFSRCSSCGTKYAVDYGDFDWPRRCAVEKCKFVTFKNPPTVSVALVRVAHGILGVRRGIQPKKGELALPGGFHNFGETWQKALVRELFEETGIVAPIEGVHLFDTMSSDDGRHHLTFGIVDLHLDALPELVQVPNPETGEVETEELVIFKGDEILAFPLHTAALHKYAEMLRLLGVRSRVAVPAM